MSGLAVGARLGAALVAAGMNAEHVPELSKLVPLPDGATDAQITVAVRQTKEKFPAAFGAGKPGAGVPPADGGRHALERARRRYGIDSKAGE